ncbi:MAG: SUMF1/EgtB/PvdO family nonheme iron enzyme [Bryobacteraceae bacterium]
MSDIFVSYSSADRSRVKPVVAALEHQGWSVWWDRSILAGKTWDRVIEEALETSRCVIVLWSRDSIKPSWVRNEAYEAQQRGILVPALLDQVNIPLAFRSIQAANLVGWSGAVPSPQFDELARAVAEVLSDSDRPKPFAMERPDGGRLAWMVQRRWISILIALPALFCLAAIVWYLRAQHAELTPLSQSSRHPAAEGQTNDPVSRQEPMRTTAPRVTSLAPAENPNEETLRPPRRRGQTLEPGQLHVNPKDGLAYVWIPSGVFMMGCSPGDGQCTSEETPTHLVELSSGFWIGQTEVTQRAFQRVMRSNPSTFTLQGFTSRNLPIPPYFDQPNQPVDNVPWATAKGYCEAVGGRLPTEAEWEYAARSGTNGPRYGDIDKIAWYVQNRGSYVSSHPVRTKEPNSWGLYDMLGNVMEWTFDYYAPYSAGDVRDPKGPAGGTYRVAPGGTYYFDANYARASARHHLILDPRGLNVGFRCTL